METGMSMSWARQPAANVAFREDEVRRDDVEPLSPVPAPVWHFRMGVLERLDAGLDVSLSGASLSGKFAIFDRDAFMMAVVASLGTWSQEVAGRGDDEFSANGPVTARLAFPMATRPAEWLELAFTPNLGVLYVQAEKREEQGLVERAYATPHAGFALGASFAVWRVRINPEVNVVGGLRPDHGDDAKRGDPGFFAVFPGVGVFLAY